MTTKKWRLLVTPLSGGTPLHQLDVEATNWMGALRASRKELGEEGGMPPGASCSVAPDGAVTILDAASRRKFLLTPTTVSVPAPGPVQAGPVAAAPAAEKAEPAASAPAHAEPQSPSQKKKKFQTVAYMPGTSAAGLTDATQPSAAAPVVASAPVAAAPQVPAQPPQPASAAQPVAAPRRARTPTPVDASQLELLFTRDEDPSAQNPLTYRERAYYVPRGMSVTEAEAALRFTLADLQNQTRAAARGKFVNLAAFDHRWTEQPERPPLIVLEWRDWRGEPSVDYPATERAPSIAPGHTGDADERIASVFESLHELSHLRSPAQGLDFVVKLLEQTVASAAISGCLYDINTDELRFVAVTGPGAAVKQGQATPRGVGLFGLAGRVEHAAMVFPDARVHPSFSPATDGREGLEVHNMMLRPVVHEGQLLAMLQLINRVGVPFSTDDVHVVNYIADRLAEFLREARVRPTT